MNSQAKLFSKAHRNDACFDVYTDSEQTIDGYSTILIHTGIKIVLPYGYEGVVRLDIVGKYV
ncbi:MAG: hypothetical protein ACTSQD_09935 [Promethearchaeota archaeon]